MSATSKTRQKSCVPCVSSKRKCDQITPFCSRCISRSIRCSYKSDEASQSHSSASESHQSPQYGIQYDTSMDFSNAMESEPSSRVLPQFSTPSLELNNNFSGTGMHEDSGDLFNNLIPIMPISTQVDDTFFTAYDAHLLSPIYPTFGVMDRDRAKYCVSALKAYPAHLALTAKTSFINLRCYPTIPPVMQDACTVAALYMTKNASNEDMVHEIINAKSNQLVHDYRSTWSVLEHLAAVQALIIFQIIRLFDGDIKQRAEAEDLEPTLRQWTKTLQQRTITPQENTPTSLLTTSYTTWLFTESVARTGIISLLVEAMYWIQKRGFCQLVDEVTAMSFTAQQALWEAKSEQHWEKARRERKSFWVQRMEFGEVLGDNSEEGAEMGDLEGLGVLLLVTYKGVEGVNEWILKKGGGGELIEV